MPLSTRRKRQTIFLDTKVKILDCLAKGQGSSAVARLYGLNEATVRTIKKNEAAIRNSYSSGTSLDTSSRAKTIKTTLDKPSRPIEVVLVTTEHNDNDEEEEEEEEPIAKIRRVDTKKIGKKLSALPSSSSSSSQSNPLDVHLKPEEHIDTNDEEPMLALGSKEHSENDERKKPISKMKKKKKRTTIYLDTKVKILDCLANGKGSSAVARLFGLNEATVRTIKKNEVAIRNSYRTSGTSINTSSRSRTINTTLDKPSLPKDVVVVAPKEHTDNDAEESMPLLSPTEHHSDNGVKEKPIPKLKKKPKRATIYLDTKIEILGRLAAGQGSTSVARHFGLNEATIRTIKKNEAAIMKSISSGTKFSAQSSAYTRDHVIEKTEKVLAVWIEHNVKKEMPIDQNSIRQTALRIYGKIKAKQPPKSSSSSSSSVEFAASTGWMRRFLKRNALTNTICSAEGFNDDILQAEIDEFIDGVLRDKEYNEFSEQNEGDNEEPILSSNIIKKGLKLANKLSNHFIKHDTNKERAEKFQHDLNLLMASYTEIDKGGLAKTRAVRLKTKKLHQ